MRTVLQAVLLAVLGVVGLMVVNTLRLDSVQEPAQAPDPFTVDLNAASAHLSAAVSLPTVSSSGPEAFLALHEQLRLNYPQVHSTLQRETISELSLLYTWPGADPSLAPVLLLAHMDVVPAGQDTASQWSHPAFDGVIVDGAVWGRGTLDDKGPLISILEATEGLIASGWRPQRTVLLAFGHDEEVGGAMGARVLAETLRARGVKPWMILDEGMVVTDGIVPGLAAPAALVGVAERGYLSIEISAEAEGGHSSMPPPHSAVGRVAQAITRLEDNPMPAELDGPTAAMFRALGAEMPLGKRFAFANLWLLRPVVTNTLTGKPSTNASVRTTTAVTMVSGGVKDNVLPTRASAVVNFRIHPRDSVAAVMAHVTQTLEGLDVKVSPYASEMGSEPAPASPSDGPEFKAIARAIQQVWPEAIVAPALVTGLTDSRHYLGLSPNVYRFGPLLLTSEDLPRLHGANERLTLENLERAVRFYAQVLRSSAGA